MKLPSLLSLGWLAAAVVSGNTITDVALTGDLHVPPVDTVTSGLVSFSYDADDDSISWSMDIDNPTQGTTAIISGGLECALPGAYGNEVVRLFSNGSSGDGSEDQSYSGTIRQEDIQTQVFCSAKTVSALWEFMIGESDQQDTEGIYVNVKAAQNVAGLLRADLGEGDEIDGTPMPTPGETPGPTTAPTLKPTIASTITPTITPQTQAPTKDDTGGEDGTISDVALTGDLHVPPVDTVTSGLVSFSYDADDDSISWSMDIDNPTQGTTAIISGGLECALPGAYGNEVVRLFSNGSSGDGSEDQSYSGTIRQEDIQTQVFCSAKTVSALWEFMIGESDQQDTEGIYVNVKAAQNVAGLLRADLGEGDEIDGTPTPSPSPTDDDNGGGEDDDMDDDSGDGAFVFGMNSFLKTMFAAAMVGLLS